MASIIRCISVSRNISKHLFEKARAEENIHFLKLVGLLSQKTKVIYLNLIANLPSNGNS